MNFDANIFAFLCGLSLGAVMALPFLAGVNHHADSILNGDLPANAARPPAPPAPPPHAATKEPNR